MSINKTLFSIATLALTLCSAQHIQPTEDERLIACELAAGRSGAAIPYRTLSFVDTNRGASVELNDDSTWLIEGQASRNNVMHWNKSDKVIIYPTFSPYWSGTKYYLYNENQRTSANAEYSRGPIAKAPLTIEIYNIDVNTREVVVMDGRNETDVWTVALADREKLRNWRTGQAVMVGFYEDCFAGWFSEHSYILINVERNEYVRASL